MRLLNLIRSVNLVHGGPAEGVRQLAAASRSLGQVHEVLTLDAPEQPWVKEFSGTIHALGPSRGTYGYTARLLPWLGEHCKDYDALIVHGLWQWHGLATRHALQGGRVPYFVFPHGMLDPFFKREYPLKHLKQWLYWPWAEYRVLRDAAAVLFTADEEARLARQTFAPLYRVREAVVGFGTEISEAATLGDAESFRAAWPRTQGRRLLLFMARIHPKKGGDLLVRAFARAAEGEPDLHLVMAGPDDGARTRDGLEALARQLGVADRITWTGMLTGEAKWSALRAAEVFVLPSHQENFGIAVAEALALRLPVLISDKVNIWREVVADGAGFAETDTPEGTVRLLQRWLGLAPESRAGMSRRARDCYDARFQMTAVARRLADTIAPHLANPARGASPVPL